MNDKYQKAKHAYISGQYGLARKIILRAQSVEEITAKITRDAFLYMDPKGQEDKFASCETCRDFTGKTCFIFGSDFPVKKTDSCALYVNGKPNPDNLGKERKAVDPKAAGYTKKAVRCENCIYGDDENNVCLLFKKLNKQLPERFDLDEKINIKGCCNAFVSIEEDNKD